MTTVLSGEFGDDGFHEFFDGGAGGSELHFQLVDQGHQLIDFGHYSALFGEVLKKEDARSTPVRRAAGVLEHLERSHRRHAAEAEAWPNNRHSNRNCLAVLG